MTVVTQLQPAPIDLSYYLNMEVGDLVEVRLRFRFALFVEGGGLLCWLSLVCFSLRCLVRLLLTPYTTPRSLFFAASTQPSSPSVYFLRLAAYVAAARRAESFLFSS